MKTIQLPIRYCDLNPPEGVPWTEEHFQLRELVWKLNSAQTALVLVDVWDIHPYASHQERATRITRERLVPVAAACRKAGISVIHAPSPGQAVKYPQWVQYAGDREIVGPPAAQRDTWPPPDFRSRNGAFAEFAKPVSQRRKKWLTEELPKRRIMACIEPTSEDFVVHNGDHLHRLLRHRGILHLIYGGFAANMCVLQRDYGIRAMFERGYNTVLLRDGTTGIESAETFPRMTHTEAAVSIVEMLWGGSCTAAALIEACG